MCLPAIPMMALQFAAMAASAKMQYDGQKAQADYQDKANALARVAFQQEEDRRVMDGERQSQQTYEAAASSANAYEAEALRQRATLDALLGESGGGTTGSRRLASMGIRQGQDLATLASNATKQQQEMGFAESADLASIRSKSASLRPGEQPSKAGLGLSLASSALTVSGRMNALNTPSR